MVNVKILSLAKNSNNTNSIMQCPLLSLSKDKLKLTVLQDDIVQLNKCAVKLESNMTSLKQALPLKTKLPTTSNVTSNPHIIHKGGGRYCFDGRESMCLNISRFSDATLPPFYRKMGADGFNEKECLYITGMYPAIKGMKVGTQLLEEAVIESYKLGLKGRTTLFAMKLSDTVLTERDKLKRISAYPGPFYVKFGFKFQDSNKQAAAEAWLKSKSKENIPSEIKEGAMYLPEEKIEEILKRRMV